MITKIWDAWVFFVKWSTILIVSITFTLSLATTIDGVFFTNHFFPFASQLSGLGLWKSIVALFLIPIGVTCFVWVTYFTVIGMWLESQIKAFTTWVNRI